MSRIRLPKLKLPVEPEGTKKNNNKSPRARHLLKKYGITEDVYESLLQEQGGMCAVCGRASTSFRTRLHIDHDHSSGRVRGLLCNYCNRRVVGRYRRETSEILRVVYNYLNKPDLPYVVPLKIKKRKKRKKKWTKI